MRLYYISSPLFHSFVRVLESRTRFDISFDILFGYLEMRLKNGWDVNLAVDFNPFVRS